MFLPRLLAATLLAASFIAPASAAETVKITLREAFVISTALASLNGRDRVAKDGSREVVVNEAYKFSAGVRIAIFKNIAKLTPIVTLYQEAMKGVRAEVSHGKPIADNSLELEELNRRSEELMKQTEEITPLVHIKTAELKLDENPIPGSVLAALSAIIDD